MWASTPTEDKEQRAEGKREGMEPLPYNGFGRVRANTVRPYGTVDGNEQGCHLGRTCRSTVNCILYTVYCLPTAHLSAVQGHAEGRAYFCAFPILLSFLSCFIPFL